jgi:hypothetical protein
MRCETVKISHHALSLERTLDDRTIGAATAAREEV